MRLSEFFWRNFAKIEIRGASRNTPKYDSYCILWRYIYLDSIERNWKNNSVLIFILLKIMVFHKNFIPRDSPSWKMMIWFCLNCPIIIINCLTFSSPRKARLEITARLGINSRIRFAREMTRERFGRGFVCIDKISHRELGSKMIFVNRCVLKWCARTKIWIGRSNHNWLLTRGMLLMTS